MRLGAPKFYEYIRAFGFGQQTGVELPGESKGLLKKIDNWSGVSIGSISMGQEIGRDAHAVGYRGVSHCQWRIALQTTRDIGNAHRRPGIAVNRRTRSGRSERSDSTGDGRDAAQIDGRCSARGRNWNPSASGRLTAAGKTVQRKR